MTPQQTLTFWRLAVGNATSIPPTAIFNDEFERGLFKENPSGEWRLSKRHPDYRAYWCEAFDYCARLLFIQTPGDRVLYLGYTGDFLHWTTHAIDVLAVVEKGDRTTVTRLADIVSRLNEFLQGVPRSWRKKGVVPVLRLSIQNANKPWNCPDAYQAHIHDEQSLLHPEEMHVLVGNTAWFAHRDTLSGLLVEPRLARCYTPAWTPVAVDILARGNHAHRLEFRKCWLAGVWSTDLLEKVQPGLVQFLNVNDNLNPEPTKWSQGLHDFMKPADIRTCPAIIEATTFSWLVAPSIP